MVENIFSLGDNTFWVVKSMFHVVYCQTTVTFLTGVILNYRLTIFKKVTPFTGVYMSTISQFGKWPHF